MCGVVGILNFKNEKINRSQIHAMLENISHRGPDGTGVFLEDNIGLGHNRLAILDLSNAGNQPMHSKDGRFVISYNGELYNYQELRKTLEKDSMNFSSHSDTEVVLNSYIKWGKKCLDQFNGMFAFCIWDRREKILFIARDRYGIKPLYYLSTPNHFIFGSEIKAILNSEAYRFSLDYEGLVEYLTFQNFFSENTLYKDIKMFSPGHFMFLDGRGNINYEQYWDYSFESDLSLNEFEATEQLDVLFKNAIQRQIISDVPVNSYLSGGIDSGAITMLAKQYLPHMNTFTIGFDLSSASGLELSFDERARAEHISYLAKTEHYEMVLKAGDMERCIDSYIWHLEEPRVGQSYPNYYAAKLASKFGKVVLSGAGGDELFGGYPWRYFYTNQNINFDDFIDNYYLKWQRLFNSDELKKLLSPIWSEVSHVDTKEIFSNVFKKIKKPHLTPEDCFNFSLYFEAKTFLHGLLTVEDKLSMAFGLEARVPFLDNDLVNFAMKIPASLKIKNYHLKADENDFFAKKMFHDEGKYLLKKTLSKYLDEYTLSNKKQGFSSPDASWFKGESLDYVSQVFQNMDSIFNKEITQDILHQHIDLEKNKRLAIWSMLYLTKFIKIFQ